MCCGGGQTCPATQYTVLWNYQKIKTLSMKAARRVIKDGPSLADFISKSGGMSAPSVSLVSHVAAEGAPVLVTSDGAHNDGETKGKLGYKYAIETYGCQMNVSDSEIIESILQTAGYSHTDKVEEANVVLLNTCAIREVSVEGERALFSGPYLPQTLKHLNLHIYICAHFFFLLFIISFETLLDLTIY